MKEKITKILFALIASFMFISPVLAEGEEETTTEATTTEAVTTTTTQATTTTTKKVTTTTAKASNANLEKILVNGKAIEEFDKDTKRYTVKVEYDTKKAIIRAVAEDDEAVVKVEGESKLEVGENEFTISVTSGTVTKNYKVIVEREEKDTKASTKLKKIKIVGYKLDFDKVSKTFYLKIDKEDTELDIVATPVDEDATVKIEGNEDLEDGSIIKIIVTSSNGDKATYKIIIEKKDTNPVPFIVIGIVVLVGISVGIFILIQNKKQAKKDAIKKKRDEYEKKKENGEDDFDEMAEDNDELEKTRQIPLVDNDEEEKTRMFSFERDELPSSEEDEEELEKTKVINFSLDDFDK